MKRTSGRHSARPIWRPMTVAVGLAALSLLAACSSGGGSASGGATANSATQNGGGAVPGQTVPTANLPVLQKVGKGEGQLNLIAWGATWTPSGSSRSSSRPAAR